MMKRTIVIVLGAALLACIGAGVFFYVSKPRVSPETVLPEGALFYVQGSDLKSALAKITSTRFWEMMRVLDYDFMMKSTGVRPEQRRVIKAVQDQISNPSLGAMLEKFFGKEFVLAVYPAELDSARISLLNKGDIVAALEQFLSTIVLVTRVGADVQVMESLFDQLNDLETETLKYEGHDVRLIVIPGAGIRVGFVRIKDFLIVGLGDRMLRRGIDVYRGKEKTLAQDAFFRRAKGRFVGSWELDGYMDLSKLLGFFKGLVKNLREQVSAGGSAAGGMGHGKTRYILRQMDNLFDQADAMEIFGFGARSGVVSEFKFDLFFDKGKVSSDMAALLACPASEDKALSFVPQDMMGYQWSNCFDLEDLWKQFKKEIVQAQEHGSPVASQLEQIQQVIGVDIEKDIVPAFGGEIGGYLSDVQMGGMFPYPHMVFFIKVNDERKARDVVAKLQQQIPGVWQSETYKDVGLAHFSSPLIGDVQPGYCFLDGYLLIGLNAKLLKGSVDALHEASLSLASSRLFTEMDPVLGGRNRSVQFLKVDQLVRKSQDVMEWAQARRTSKDTQGQAFKLGGEKRLEDTRAAIARKSAELAELKSRQTALEDEAWNMNARGADDGRQQAQMSELKEKIASQEREIASDKEQEAELEKILKGYDRPSADQERKDEILKKAVYPLLKSLSSVKAMGIRTTLEDKVLEANILLKVE
jgi:hypothetical protein